MLKVATRSTARRPLLHLAKRPLPAKQMTVQVTSTIVAQMYCHQKPSGSHCCQFPFSEPKFSMKQSIKPTAFIPTYCQWHPLLTCWVPTSVENKAQIEYEAYGTAKFLTK